METYHSFSNKRTNGIPSGSISHNLKILVIDANVKETFFSILSTEEDYEKRTSTFPDPDLFDGPVASCHEFLLTVKNKYDDDEVLALWNPSTKNYLRLPPSIRPPSVKYLLKNGFFGLGLDPNTTDDYKVVSFLELHYEDISTKDSRYVGKNIVQLYSPKNGSWKRIPFPHVDDDFIPDLADPIYINGFNYWIAFTDADGKNEKLVVVSFDYAKESFALIPGPNKPYKPYKLDIHLWHCFLLAECDGLLALLVYDKHQKQLEQLVWNEVGGSWSTREKWKVGNWIVGVFTPLAFLKNQLFCFSIVQTKS